MYKQRQSIWKFVAGVILPLTLLTAASTSAPLAHAGATVTSASSLGLFLATVRRRLLVLSVTGMADQSGIRVGDQIVAVSGRRVSTEAAFLNRLSMARRGSSTVTVTIARNGLLANIVVPALPRGGQVESRTTAGASNGRRGGWMNPDLMVRTSQGVMHRDAAARLGLEGTPLPSSAGAASRGSSPAATGGGWMNPSLMVRTPMGVMHRDAAIRF